MSGKFGVGVLGAGWVSGEHIKAYCRNPHTELVGIVSRTREGAERKLAELGVDCKVFDSYEDMLRCDDIQIISVCTPPDNHRDAVVLGAEAGKHLVVEKPLAMAWEDVVAMRDAVRKAGVKTVVSFVLRWNPLLVTIKSLLEDDALGRVFLAECDYWHYIGPHYGQFRWSKTKRAGGSSLLSAGCHAVDALRWFMGEVEEVYGYSTPPYFPNSEYEFDPNIVAILRFASGAMGKVSSCLECRTPYIFNIELLGDKGTIRNNQLYSQKFPGQTGYLSFPTILPDSGDVTHHPFQEEINHFVECILSGRESHANLEDAAKTMEVCFAIDRSIESHSPVRLPLPL